MKDEIRRERLKAAHTRIASEHPYREIFAQAIRPFVVPVLGVAVGLLLLILGVRFLVSMVSWLSMPVVLTVVLVTFLVGVAAAVLGRGRHRLPRSLAKYADDYDYDDVNDDDEEADGDA